MEKKKKKKKESIFSSYCLRCLQEISVDYRLSPQRSDRRANQTPFGNPSSRVYLIAYPLSSLLWTSISAIIRNATFSMSPRPTPSYSTRRLRQSLLITLIYIYIYIEKIIYLFLNFKYLFIPFQLLLDFSRHVLEAKFKYFMDEFVCPNSIVVRFSHHVLEANLINGGEFKYLMYLYVCSNSIIFV